MTRHPLNLLRCICSRRSYASAAPLKVDPTFDTHLDPPQSTRAESSRSRIVAGLILSRAPLVLPPQSEFEKSYYSYSRKVRRALSDDFNRERYFRPGSQAERAFLDREEELDRSDEKEQEQQDFQNETPLISLNRKLNRTLYLLLRKKRKTGEKGEWQFPQGGVEESDASLLRAAVREVEEEVGLDMDIFTPSKVPASIFTYSPPTSHPYAANFDNTQVYLLPARILRGQAKLTPQAQQESITEFAWCTKEEVRERVDQEYWKVALKEGHLLAD